MIATGGNLGMAGHASVGVSPSGPGRLVDSPVENQRRLQAFMSVSQEEEVEWVGDGATGTINSNGGPFSFRGNKAGEHIITEHSERVEDDDSEKLIEYRSKLYESLQHSNRL